MLQRSFTIFLITLYGSFTHAIAQNAEVTFYSNGPIAKTLLPYSSGGLFYGWLYDGTQKLTWISRDQFVTFSLPAGVHHFSGSTSGNHPAANSDLQLELVTGERKFVSVSSVIKNAIVAETMKGVLTEVSCADAQIQASYLKPAKDKYVPKEIRSTLVQLSSFPSCKP